MIVFCAKNLFYKRAAKSFALSRVFLLETKSLETKCAAALQEPKEEACSVFFSVAEKQEDMSFIL